MPILRLLIIALIIGGLVYLYRRLTRASSRNEQLPPQARSTHALKCELCGLHVPEEEVVRREGHVYCCQDHANKARLP